jgi:hypothetical protein
MDGFLNNCLKLSYFYDTGFFRPMKLLLLFLQLETICQKMEEAPDKGYEIGVVIGTYLPLILLIGFAWLMFYLAKKRNKDS